MTQKNTASGATPETLLKNLLDRLPGATLALAESCTGGLIAARVTSVPGSSAYFDRGVVVYSNRAKIDLLGVDPGVLEKFGAVSRETAEGMVNGLFDRTPASLGAAVTGIAGPDGGTPEKPVGTVWIAWGTRGSVRSELLALSGDRTAVRERAVEIVLKKLCETAGALSCGRS